MAKLRDDVLNVGRELLRRLDLEAFEAWHVVHLGRPLGSRRHPFEMAINVARDPVMAVRLFDAVYPFEDPKQDAARAGCLVAAVVATVIMTCAAIAGMIGGIAYLFGG